MTYDRPLDRDQVTEMLTQRETAADDLLTSDSLRQRLFAVVALAPDVDDVLDHLTEVEGVDGVSLLLRAICIELLRSV